jgi:hypothetical protein
VKEQILLQYIVNVAVFRRNVPVLPVFAQFPHQPGTNLYGEIGGKSRMFIDTGSTVYYNN